MKPIRYTAFQQLGDVFHGWRDGQAEIPVRPPGGGHVTTSHRDVLIRTALDVFAAEEQRYLVESTPGRMKAEAALARRDALTKERADAADWLAANTVPPTPPELRRRRYREDHHPESVIVARRGREHRFRTQNAAAWLQQVDARLNAAEADLAAAAAEVDQHRRTAYARILRFHEHTHRRLALYRRHLVRRHPLGAWVNAVLSGPAPEIPGWTLPESLVELTGMPPAVPPEPDADEEPAAQAPDEPAAETLRLPPDPVCFGSDPSCAVQVTGPLVASRHFTLTREDQGARLLLRAHAPRGGPYVDGATPGSAMLLPGDHFDFAGRRYTVVSGDELETRPLGRCDLVVHGLSAKGGRGGAANRLTDMSFVLHERRLLAILGPSGAGKSSLFKALLGELAVEPGGELFFLGVDVLSRPDQLRENLGFVPQDIHLHSTLTTRTLLRYAFDLRSSAGFTARENAIDEAIAKLGLDRQADQLVSTLSGGQQRRVSIAMELLTDPPLLMLDEPTSGLDPSMDREVMGILRERAAAGRTVVVVTHATEHLPWAEQILVVAGQGAPVFFGTPRQIRRKLGFGSYAELMRRLIEDPAPYTRAYRAGAGRGVAKEAEKARGAGLREIPRTGPRPRKRRFGEFHRQYRIMVRRQFALVRARGLGKRPQERTVVDLAKATLVPLLPLIVSGLAALVAVLVTDSPGLGTGGTPDVALTALSLLTTLCVLGGTALTYSDIVGEFEIIKREHRTGASLTAILAAKWTVFACFAVLQAVLITLVFTWTGRGPQTSLSGHPVPEMAVGLAALSVASMTVGLLISVVAQKLEQAVTFVTMTTIMQIAFNGATADLSQNPILGAVGCALPDRWGLALVGAGIDLRALSHNPAGPETGIEDALWTHTADQWLTAFGALTLLSIAAFATAAWRLHRRLRPARAAVARGDHADLDRRAR